MRLNTRSLGAAAVVLLSGGFVSAAVVPISVTGFNQDMFVDAAATAGTDVSGFVTATMDAGTAKTGGNFYQIGFVTASPTTGLPTGTTVNSATGNGGFQFQAANVNNAVLLNNTTPTGTLTLTSPARYSQIALYDSTGNGSGTITYTINFAGGATESGTYTSGDWFNASPVAYTAAGRVNNVMTGATDNVGSTNPRVYEHLLNVANTGAAINSISLSRATGQGNTAVFAVSGTVVPEPASLGLVALGGLGLLARRRRV